MKNKVLTDRALSKVALQVDLTALEAKSEARETRLNYQCKDLKNTIKTTDRYIDQFLPFRMIKEVSSFMEFLMDNQ